MITKSLNKKFILLSLLTVKLVKSQLIHSNVKRLAYSLCACKNASRILVRQHEAVQGQIWTDKGAVNIPVLIFVSDWVVF